MADSIWRSLNQEIYNEELLKKLSGYPLYLTNKPRMGSERHLQILQDTRVLSKFIKEYVVSTKESHTIRELVEKSFLCLGINGVWSGTGLDEKFLITTCDKNNQNIKSSPLVKINALYFRPSDVTFLNGDSSKITKELGWKSTLSFNQLIDRMVKWDLKQV